MKYSQFTNGRAGHPEAALIHARSHCRKYDMASFEDRLSALEREAQWQRDHIEIRQLIASYGPLVDTADQQVRAQRLAELWLEDGEYDIGGVHPCKGRAAIAAVFEERHFDQVPEGVCHVMGLPFITVTGDEASALNYSCVMRPDGDARFFPWRVSANHWELVRQQGRWWIRRRTNRLMTGDPQALTLLRSIDTMMQDPSAAAPDPETT
jgi:hypothetical protein